MRIPRPRSKVGKVTLAVLGVPLLLAAATAVYHDASGEKFCGHCHEMADNIASWQGSTHRSTACKGCHGGILTLDAGFHLTNFRRLSAHLRDEVPERLLVKDDALDGIQERCRSCHREEWADWEAGPHGLNYAKVFLNEAHNREVQLMDDCLRCHGMYFEGSIGDLVRPTETRGPWALVRSQMGKRPAIPCLACHEVHRPGEPLGALAKADPPKGSAAEEIHRPSLAFFDRRSQMHIPTGRLPLPAMLEGERAVKVSPDPRQGICYQCHAPKAGFQVCSGDDRTPIGVHEGIGCLACHAPHGETTRASCASCHPRLSNCGLPVETMDTTFKSRDSKRDIHFVKCADCHPGGPPPRAGKKI